MATCENCGAVEVRTRTIWSEDGAKREECPRCAPASFEKFMVPSDKKIWMGYEAHPNEYVKAADGGFDRKPEYRAEQEARLRNETEDERNARLRAEAKKRKERRVTPMDGVELSAAMVKAERIANWIQASTAEGRDVV